MNSLEIWLLLGFSWRFFWKTKTKSFHYIIFAAAMDVLQTLALCTLSHLDSLHKFKVFCPTCGLFRKEAYSRLSNPSIQTETCGLTSLGNTVFAEQRFMTTFYWNSKLNWIPSLTTNHIWYERFTSLSSIECNYHYHLSVNIAPMKCDFNLCHVNFAKQAYPANRR